MNSWLNWLDRVSIYLYEWARGSVDRASGSGPEERGFESLRAHISKSSKDIILAAFLWEIIDR